MEKLDLIPEFLKNKLINKYGEENAEKIAEGYLLKRKLTFRINNVKSNNDEVEKVLKDVNIRFQKPSFYKDAFIIPDSSKDEIEKLDIYKEGKIYMQSLSSMIPVIMLEPKKGEDILDMAAAPGGKTTQIASICNNEVNLTAVERNPIRAERLKYNINMQKAKAFVMVKDAREIDDFFSFDKILLDAPCSGSGIIDLSNENYKKYFTEELILKSRKTQIALLKKAIRLLKKGGEMVYSTCSILEEENESVINEILKTNKDIELVDLENEKFIGVPVLNTMLNNKALCVMPNDEYEGFFAIKIRKIK